MSPLFMDTGYEPTSPGSISADEWNSNTAESEREGEGHQAEKRGKKRREKNRDAARKSRRKQTERADELHEELQRLERSNSAFQKEIAVLKKDLHRYTTALKHHEPYCNLRASKSSSSPTTHLSVPPSAKCQTNSSPCAVTPQTSSSSSATPPSVSTSLTSSLSHQTLECVENTHLSPAATTLAPSSGSSAKLAISSSSSPATLPHLVSFPTPPAPHSLFSEESPITPWLTNVTPVCTSLVSTPIPPSTLTTAAQPKSRQENIHGTSSMPANACFSTLNSGSLDPFLMKQTSFITAPSNVLPHYTPLAGQDGGLGAQDCPMNLPQLHQAHYSETPDNSSLPCTFLASTPQDPSFQSLTVSPQANLGPSPAPACALKPSHRQQTTPNSASLLSLLTIPSPIIISQTTSTTASCQPLPSLPLLGDPPTDISLSEFLEVNDWILNGTSNQ